MKSIAEGIKYIKDNFNPSDEITYESLDSFLEITGAPWLERQNLRINYVKRLNTKLRRGEVFGDSIRYLSLWVFERNKSFVLMPLSTIMLKDSQRTYSSIAAQLDDMAREYSRALGYESYTSRVTGNEIKFRGERPLLSNNEIQMLERHMDVLIAITPMLESAERARNNAAKCLNLLVGPQLSFES